MTLYDTVQATIETKIVHRCITAVRIVYFTLREAASSNATGYLGQDISSIVALEVHLEKSEHH